MRLAHVFIILPAEFQVETVVYVFSHYTCRLLLIWLGSVHVVIVRASDVWSTGREFDSRPYSAGFVLGWVTVCGRVNHLGM